MTRTSARRSKPSRLPVVWAQDHQFEVRAVVAAPKANQPTPIRPFLIHLSETGTTRLVRAFRQP